MEEEIKQRLKKQKASLKQWKNSQVCVACGSTKNLTLHHLIPRNLKGKTIKSNLIVLCRKCHTDEHRIGCKKYQNEEELELIVLLRKQGYNENEIYDFLGVY